MPHLAGGLLETWHEIQVYLYITCVWSSSQLGAFHSIKSSLFSLFQVHFHASSVYTQQCMLEENITVNRIMFSFHSNTEQSMSFTFVLSKYVIGRYFKMLTSNVNMYCNTNREVTTCSCWTTAHFEKVVKRVKELFQVFSF